MTPEEFFSKIQQRLPALKQYLERDLPRIAGKMAVDFYKDSFRNQGFTDKSLEKWKPSKRTLYGNKYAASQYGTLLSSRNELMESITYKAGIGFVVISSDKEYAQIHNEGGPVNFNINVTPKMRRFAWAKHYQAEKGSEEAGKWKGMALSKKTSFNIKYDMPKRQFIGESATLSEKITEKAQQGITNILNN
ncbi:MAG: hypothetical protein CVU12_01990 [Bacteroidetes bacterium HGW-Bacteroidetes-7]|jgi:phage gpG-like protein|nr:MAG: hypothetical protein CVU12_01990 [Bacteroidetes bacterium HGW-Bacteroidetes-7]